MIPELKDAIMMSRFVLVHGAWSDSAAWDAVAARLAVPLGAQLEMVSGTGGVAAAWRLATSHMPMLSDPDGLADALLDLTA